MKTTLFLFLFFFASNILSGQQPADSAKIYYNVITNSPKKSDLPSAINFFKNRKKQSLKVKDTASAIYAIRLIAQATYNEGNFSESELESVEGLTLLGNKQSESFQNDRMGLYTQLGMVYRKLLNYEEAIKIYTTALSHNPNPTEKTRILNNIGNVYKSLKKYPQAKDYLERAFVASRSMENVDLQALVLDNLGEVQHYMDDAQALNTMHKALRLREKSNNLKHKYTSYMSLAAFYTQSNADSSRFYAKKAIALSDSLQNTLYKRDALNVLMQTNPDMDVKEYVKLSDSILAVVQLDDNKYAFRKWNIANAEKQTALVEIEKEEEKNQRILYQWIGILIVFIGILLFIVFRLKHKRDKIEQEYNTETRIAKKVHDEIANDVYQLMATIQTSKNESETLLDDLESIYLKTRDISKEISLIQMDEDFGKVISSLLLNYQSDQVNVISKNLSSLNWSSVSDLKKITLYRVLQELMTNMLKHSKATIVVITANQSGKKLDLTYTDNGIGSDLKKGNGLLNTENRIRSVKGTIIFDSTINKGFTAKISL
ncbi:MAG: tetratricopeptide repeat-containing sensor histidine kinase [Patiriisocius sp.]|uniref:tetratricopeptide repeat-containing sensor histidine kinase n=1 Tax=Patiriisocius sp. TaxID=2822396 RepID=UPI003EF20BE9